MAMARRKIEPQAEFTVPAPGEAHDGVRDHGNELEELKKQHRELKSREAAVSEKVRSNYNGGYTPEGSTAREQARALDGLRNELAEIRQELIIVKRAIGEAEAAYQNAIRVASQKVCKKVEPEWNARLRAVVLPLFQFFEAHCSQMDLKEQLFAKDVRWTSHLTNVQFTRMADMLNRDTLNELINGGVIKKSEVPAVMRDRFDI